MVGSVCPALPAAARRLIMWQQVHIRRVVSTTEGEDGAEPLLGQGGALDRELAAQDGQVVEGLGVQLVVDDGEEGVDHQAVLAASRHWMFSS